MSRFVPFTLTAEARTGGERVFRTDIERITACRIEGARLEHIKAKGGRAVLRGVIPESEHTADNASLAQFLEDRLGTEKGIYLDLVVAIHN